MEINCEVHMTMKVSFVNVTLKTMHVSLDVAQTRLKDNSIPYNLEGKDYYIFLAMAFLSYFKPCL